MVVEVELFRAVVVGDVQVGPTVAIEVGRCRGEGPPAASHSHPLRHILELAVSEIVKEQIASAVGRELEAIVHDPRRR